MLNDILRPRLCSGQNVKIEALGREWVPLDKHSLFVAMDIFSNSQFWAIRVEGMEPTHAVEFHNQRTAYPVTPYKSLQSRGRSEPAQAM